ncbi:MAG: hypothetical protein FJ304_07740 [Planctomycetes bacterium]|nr:hypothetical protein [Planctomycetota bacterium]
MEELVALLVQLVLEVGLQIFGSLGFDFATESRNKKGDKGETREHDGCGWLVAFAVFGGICGGLSLIFAPKLLLPNIGLRVANLVCAPLVAGGVSYLVARHVWAPQGQSAGHHFWRGFWFALAFGLVRFAYATQR